MDPGRGERTPEPALETWPRRAAAAGSVAVAAALPFLVLTLSGSLTGALCGLAITAPLAVACCERLLRPDPTRHEALRTALAVLGRGEIPGRFEPERMGSLAGEAHALNALAERLVAFSRRVLDLSARLESLPELLGGALAGIDQGAESQEAAVEEAASLVADIDARIREINDQIENLARANEETASSVLEMGASIEEVARNAATLEDSVESSTAAVHQMGAQIRKVAEHSDTVKDVAEETAASIREMDRTLQQVGEYVRGASELTERVRETADDGSAAVGATIEGIASIRDLTLGAKKALEGLDLRVGEVGEIATVISGISDETNLLSLNAAIIAAQAGEHGKPFAVVAEQVKTLARRTTESAKRIEHLIRSVQLESENAVRAMGAGIRGVEEGVERSRHAGSALRAIREAAREANGRVAGIAQATQEQLRNSEQVALSAQRSSELVQQISAAMAEQASASEQLLANATSALGLCRQMTSATEEQHASGRYISTRIGSITEMIRAIQKSTESHARASAGVSRAVSAILDGALKSTERIPEALALVDELRGRAAHVRSDAAYAVDSAERRSG